MDSSKQLETVCCVKLYEYEYKNGVIEGGGKGGGRGEEGKGGGGGGGGVREKGTSRVGVLAQELRHILPDAVQDSVSCSLADHNNYYNYFIG